MASDLEKVLAQAKYTALPLPREKSAPTTIYSFHDGQLFIVRNAHSCLPDPPLAVTEDHSADTLQFQREFSFDLKGIVSFLLKVFSIGQAKAEFDFKSINSATVEMGGLQHETIETGALLDYLMNAQRNSCLRDILDKNNFTVIAALKASTFTYTFKNSKGATVSLTLPEAQGLFKADVTTNISVTNDGKVVVKSPCYVGVISWKGDTLAKEIEKARKFQARPSFAEVHYKAPSAFANAAGIEEIRAVRDASVTRTRQRTPLKPKASARGAGGKR